MAEQINVEINKIPISGVTLTDIEALEAQIYANDITARMKKLEQETGKVDTLQLALLTALVLSSELAKAREEIKQSSQSSLVKVDKMIKTLSDTLHEKTTGTK